MSYSYYETSSRTDRFSVEGERHCSNVQNFSQSEKKGDQLFIFLKVISNEHYS